MPRDGVPTLPVSAPQKNPSVSTVSGPRPLDSNGNFVALAGIAKSGDISSPFPFVEIRG